MNDQATQAKIDKRIALSMKHDDEWEKTSFDDLSPEANMDIRVARRLGFALFFPAMPNATMQALATLKAARKYLKANL